jgi:hypothetical protein
MESHFTRPLAPQKTTNEMDFFSITEFGFIDLTPMNALTPQMMLCGDFWRD